MSDFDAPVLDCGKTLEELNDYLDRGRVPRDPSIEECPSCLNALDALTRVGVLSRDLISEDAAQLPAPPESWFAAIMDTVRTELRAGREFPIRHPDPRVRITVTEGAVRSLLRATGDTIDGLYVGRTEIIGDAEEPGAPVEIRLSASVAWGMPMQELSATLQELVRRVLAQHTDLNVTAVNVTVEDIHGVESLKDRG